MQFSPERPAFGGLFDVVRPAWVHSSGWKSHRKQVMASEEKHNCVRATERGEEAWIEPAGTLDPSGDVLRRTDMLVPI